METLSSIIKNQGENPSMKPKLTRWGGGGGAYLTKSFQTSASTRRTRQSDATRFDQNKQIFFKYFVKD